MCERAHACGYVNVIVDAEVYIHMGENCTISPQIMALFPACCHLFLCGVTFMSGPIARRLSHPSKYKRLQTW